MVAMALHLFSKAQSSATDDGGLMAALAARDAAAFETLMQRHYEVVYRVVWRMMHGHADSEDVTQEAFLRLWRNPSQLREASALRGWLIRVASNIVADRHRGLVPAPQDMPEDVIDDTPIADEELERKRIARRVDIAISRLPDRQRLALSLVQFENMGQAAAAEIMEISVDALESLLARAKRALKQDLAAEWRDMLEGLAE
jgi:RNA polymerase sigma-70 factor, ECF subfamily